MTLPNKLTVGRLVLTPVFFGLYIFTVLGDSILFSGMIALWVLQLVMEVSDVLDGYIARSRNLVSDMGKIMDPFADVISRVTYFVCFTFSGLMPLWALMIILWREFCIMFIRMVMAKEGTALAAKWGGKAKAVFYFISGIFGLLVLTMQSLGAVEYLSEMQLAARWLFILAAASSLLSFIEYLVLFLKTDTMKHFISE
ncbi:MULTISPECIES: CDP-diacylglycerol--glycerol-3-phosphate 3-phosphatidyltransferase [unclassified Oceanispirochaeta]|uniref:CDP-diacylglycerol--glycerol-3-phosphate 3-phosphatidyltransferase n=1 Tax=unclassified Oceanispirochaeta TaxID=2635722 RepID=UPI000E09C715|nr:MULTISPECIES: CDP-diacylglycerol--glycerol-3-phosphate 3-phosphatidyltransferase [unclassified Oceanispirochaeta]MBF9014216.1 CDP-diacylglycerol--glycerol-3-phosphate 3-phosphatidyltransferase [Oceanispirochaeta sp. M2]NPD71102.1 CDP-diacylglycerol--glycerol-3-phosphate 3-phosphatidyltransferase [Oceanispirochaeta sp. M1]RDG33498.1 CDP-diacylglycerol--glycerol-3-phosphate 3-phosphatidyltransferase [Oceanispirochaeta sp. M1]